MKLFNSLLVLSVGISSLFMQLHADEDNFYQTYRESAISSASGTPWNAARHLMLVQKAGDFRSQLNLDGQKKPYPLSESDLEEIYQNAQNSTVSFFAYSSMIDKEAGATKATSPGAAATQTPAIAFGIQRTFNREMAASTIEGGWGALKRPNDLAILNIFEKKDAVLNGVVFQLPLSDLLILSKREVGYDLIPIVAVRWNEAIDGQMEPEFFLAYTFIAPDYSGDGPRYTNPHVNPVQGYFNYLQKGLETMGADFKAMWWATTYLADQKTAVKDLPYNIVDMQPKEKD